MTTNVSKCGVGRGTLDSLPASPLKNRNTVDPAWLSNAFGINQEQKSGNSGLKEKTELQPAPPTPGHTSWRSADKDGQAGPMGPSQVKTSPLSSTLAPLWSI